MAPVKQMVEAKEPARQGWENFRRGSSSKASQHEPDWSDRQLYPHLPTALTFSPSQCSGIRETFGARLAVGSPEAGDLEQSRPTSAKLQERMQRAEWLVLLQQRLSNGDGPSWNKTFNRVKRQGIQRLSDGEASKALLQVARHPASRHHILPMFEQLCSRTGHTPSNAVWRTFLQHAPVLPQEHLRFLHSSYMLASPEDEWLDQGVLMLLLQHLAHHGREDEASKLFRQALKLFGKGLRPEIWANHMRMVSEAEDYPKMRVVFEEWHRDYRSASPHPYSTLLLRTSVHRPKRFYEDLQLAMNDRQGNSVEVCTAIMSHLVRQQHPRLALSLLNQVMYGKDSVSEDFARLAFLALRQQAQSSSFRQRSRPVALPAQLEQLGCTFQTSEVSFRRMSAAILDRVELKKCPSANLWTAILTATVSQRDWPALCAFVEAVSWLKVELNASLDVKISVMLIELFQRRKISFPDEWLPLTPRRRGFDVAFELQRQLLLYRGRFRDGCLPNGRDGDRHREQQRVAEAQGGVIAIHHAEKSSWRFLKEMARVCWAVGRLQPRDQDQRLGWKEACDRAGRELLGPLRWKGIRSRSASLQLESL